MQPGVREAARLLGLIVLAAIFAPWITPHDPYQASMLDRLTPPAWASQGTAEYLLGTDELGRDILTRLIYGARVTLLMSISPVLMALMIGGTLGLIAGYAGGKINMCKPKAFSALLASSPTVTVSPSN